MLAPPEHKVGRSTVHSEVLLLESADPLAVLVLEPCAEDEQRIWEYLRAARIAFEPVIVRSLEEFSAALPQREFALVLSAFQLPAGDGLDALRSLRIANPDTPFILVSGTIEEVVAVECLRRGVNDYVLKDHLA